MKAYKYNEEKSIAWLENKIRKLAKILKEKNIHVTAGAVSATFICSNVSNENVDEGKNNYNSMLNDELL